MNMETLERNAPAGRPEAMSNFTVPPMEVIRVGFIGLGNRGLTAVKRVSGLPGIEVAALADIQDVQVEESRQAAREKGGHGGMDYIMDLRWSHCLHKGLPLDMDVYDLASWSSVVPCSAASDKQGGLPVELPDFTRGAWRTARPADIGDVE